MSIQDGQRSLHGTSSVKVRYRSNRKKEKKQKVRAVLESSRLATPTEVRSFLGMVGFSARFCHHIAEPLRAISRQGVPFVWHSEQEASFQELKQKLTSAPVLAYFDKEAHTRVIADASPVGLGAVLVQETNGVGRAVCHASRSLTSVERRYSQTEKEALALLIVGMRTVQPILVRLADL